MVDTGTNARPRVAVLGELLATRGALRVELGGRRQRAVLALLVIARGQVVTADALIESVWRDCPPANAGAALQSYVSHLRRRLQPEAGARSRDGVIVSSGTGYAVALPDDGVDAWQFELWLREATSSPVECVERLTAALDLWRGPAYVEYADEPWAQAEAARLHELRNVARERLAEARLDSGEAALLVPELERLVTEQPLREERWRLLALALYRSSRQADALAALRRARSTLADELGVDPGPALQALEAEVLRQSPALEVPAQRIPAALTGGKPPAALSRVEPAELPVLLGRDRELGELHTALQDVLGGASRLLVIQGGAGIGKTALLRAVVRHAVTQDVHVLSASATPLEQAFGFGVVRQLFEPFLLDEAQRSLVLRGPAAAAAPVFDDVPAGPGDTPFAHLHGLYWATTNLANERPVVLAVDDVQWCDQPSLRYLAYLVKRLDALPVLVLATLRSGEADEDDVVAEIALDERATALHPAPLAPEHVTHLVAEHLGEPAESFATACHKTTGGNPLLLRQLLRALQAQRVKPDRSHADTVRAIGSRAVSSLVLLRLRRMPPPATAVARAVAVLGPGAELPHVASLAGMSESECLAATAGLIRAEVLRDDCRLDFVHPLVREAVYRDLPAIERAVQHQRAAQLLHQDSSNAPDLDRTVVLAGPDAAVSSTAQEARNRGPGS